MFDPPSSSLQSPVSRETEVVHAVQTNGLLRLQELSLLPGGFGNARVQAWPFLLGVDVLAAKVTAEPSATARSHCHRESSLSDSCAQPYEHSTQISSEISPIRPQDCSLDDSDSHISSKATECSPHPDEHQVQLDTDRSFVLYPVENRSLSQRKLLQEDLHDIILGVLRKRPNLRYFQGYHDIITVLFLTLPPEVVLSSVEKLSLHRLRDSMGTGLEPLVAQLRILKRLLRIIDPSYAEILEQHSPLPYYALSNLLTLFAHDVPTLPLIQHIFDWLLCREPVAAIWLAATVILDRKEDVLALERAGDEALGMIHAVLLTLPPLSDGEVASRNSRATSTELQVSDVSEFLELSGDILPEILDQKKEGETSGSSSLSLNAVEDNAGEKVLKSTSVVKPQETGQECKEIDGESKSPSSESLFDSLTTDSAASSPPVVVSPVQPNSELGSEDVCEDSAGRETGGNRTQTTRETRSRTQSHSPSQSRSRSCSLPSFPGGYKEKPHVPPLPLCTLLRRASDLLAAYPPSSPALGLAQTFGPQSALRPCNYSAEDVHITLDDDEAEACVGGPSVVLLSLSKEEQEEELGLPRKSKDERRVPGKRQGHNKWPIRLTNGMVVRRRTVLASVVLLLSVAVALYGFGRGGRVGLGGPRHGRFGHGQMRWVAAWVGGLLGVGERLGVGLG